ncbi:uncharacterized protein LOC105703596 [Orussus abietinus]|uniref:uncharacterized protein LOC105703596 n=1 Tax=Orussus abietinus TaxID=222816 RepID=UPI0006254821|nr:uncharacterized protein LOC105703596 [Orussus abietinus]
MILIYVTCLGILAPVIAASDKNSNSKANVHFEDKGFKDSSQFRDVVLAGLDYLRSSVETSIPVEGRKKKKGKYNKYVLPLIVGFLLIKSILLPIALKALAVLSGKAVVLSLMSLILAAIVGLKKVAQSSSSGSNYDVVNVPIGKYRRQDSFGSKDELGDDRPYNFYRDRRRRK